MTSLSPLQPSMIWIMPSHVVLRWRWRGRDRTTIFLCWIAYDPESKWNKTKRKKCTFSPSTIAKVWFPPSTAKSGIQPPRTIKIVCFTPSAVLQVVFYIFIDFSPLSYFFALNWGSKRESKFMKISVVVEESTNSPILQRLNLNKFEN